MLHDRDLPQHLSLIHLKQPGIDLVPIGHAADIIQHGGVLSKGSFLHLLHERDTREIKVLVREALEYILVVDRLRLHVLVINQLRRPKNEGQEVVVVQAPNPVGPSRLKAVNQLQFPHQVQVLDKNLSYHRLVVFLLD